MRFNKRASLEIGVNTIVILVIAMTLLGLGVVFVRNLFSKVSSTVGIINPEDVSNPPTAAKPIKLIPAEVELKTGKTEPVQVLVYNRGSQQAFSIGISCSGGWYPEIDAYQGVTIEQGEFVGFKVLITATVRDPEIYEDEDVDGGPAMGTNFEARRHICQITATGNAPDEPQVYSEQFIMRVVS